jgi:hypothetical protein
MQHRLIHAGAFICRQKNRVNAPNKPGNIHSVLFFLRLLKRLRLIWKRQGAMKIQTDWN